jgi:hypothetical protein
LFLKAQGSREKWMVTQMGTTIYDLKNCYNKLNNKKQRECEVIIFLNIMAI